jgi:hypothetical protein
MDPFLDPKYPQKIKVDNVKLPRGHSVDLKDHSTCLVRYNFYNSHGHHRENV